MSEFILAGIILALLGFIAYQEWSNRKERSKFLNALISKTPEQFRDLELTAKVKPITPQVPVQSDFVPENELSNEEFLKNINNEVNNQ